MLKTKPRTVWTMGYQLTSNDLVKAMIRAHVIAVQEYDHKTAMLIEQFIKDYATRYGAK